MRSIDAAQLDAAISEKIFALRGLLEEYAAALQDRTCKDFLRAVRLLIDGIEESHGSWAAHLKRQFPSNAAKVSEHLHTYSLITLRILSNIHEQYLPLLSAATEQTALPLLSILRRAINLVGGKNDTIELALVPKFEYTYGFTGFIELSLTELKKLPHLDPQKWALIISEAEKLPRYCVFLSYPAIDQCSPLRLTVLVHELAHLIDYIRELYKHVMPSTLDPTSFNAYVKRVEQSVKPQVVEREGQQLALEMPSHDQIEWDCYEKCDTTVRAWLREIIADVLAIRAIGPAFLFSFLEFLAQAGFTNEPDIEHPAPAKRMELMLAELKHMGYFDTKHGLTVDLDLLYEKILRESASTKYEMEDDVADKTIAANLDKILPLIRASVGTGSYDVHRYISEVPAASKKLAAGIAPIEVGVGAEARPLSAVAILNAGWEVYRTNLSAFGSLFVEGMKQTEIVKNLNQLLFKALEASELVRKWKEI